VKKERIDLPNNELLIRRKQEDQNSEDFFLKNKLVRKHAHGKVVKNADGTQEIIGVFTDETYPEHDSRRHPLNIVTKVNPSADSLLLVENNLLARKELVGKTILPLGKGSNTFESCFEIAKGGSSLKNNRPLEFNDFENEGWSAGLIKETGLVVLRNGDLFYGVSLEQLFGTSSHNITKEKFNLLLSKMRQV